MSFWENDEFKEFWNYLQKESIETDAWWLDDWLDNTLEHWKELPLCPHCKKKLIFKSVDHYDKTRNYILETEYFCKHCATLIKTDDQREHLIEKVKKGEVKVKYLPSLCKELDIKFIKQDILRSYEKLRGSQ